MRTSVDHISPPQRIHRALATKVSAVISSWATWHMVGRCKSPNHECGEASTTTDTTGRSAAMHWATVGENTLVFKNQLCARVVSVLMYLFWLL